MGEYAFYIFWGVSFIVLIVIAGAIGKVAPTNAYLGILIDSRGRYSLTHFQVVTWTMLILSSLCGVLIATKLDWQQLRLEPELLGLMGISAGSGVLATAVKAVKDASGSARIARVGPKGLTLSPGSTPATRDITAQLSQLWLLEEGDNADKVIDIAKFQNFVFTVIAVVFYVTLACKQGKVPELPDNVIWLIGISHAGYVTGKAPDKK